MSIAIPPLEATCHSLNGWWSLTTAPEIEMLIIHNEGKYKQFKNSNKKPSDFCKIDLKMANVKDYDFVKEYFRDPAVLIRAITKYKENVKTRNDEKMLWNLLRH